jgi:hypothetical protein
LLAAEKAKANARWGRRFFEQGRHPQDYIQAHKWYNLAVASYAPSDVELTRWRRTRQTRHEMTTDQIAEAQRIVQEWHHNQRIAGPTVAELNWRTRPLRTWLLLALPWLAASSNFGP